MYGVDLFKPVMSILHAVLVQAAFSFQRCRCQTQVQRAFRRTPRLQFVGQGACRRVVSGVPSAAARM